MLFGMCQSQYDIKVEQQWTRIERKKDRDTMKQLHAHFGFQPPRPPISPTPPEVEIPSFDQQMRTIINSNMINEVDLCSSSQARVAPPQLHLLHHLVQRRPLGLTVCHRDQQRTLHLSAPQLPHLHLRMIQRRQRHLRTRRDAFLLRYLVWSGYPPPYQGGSSHPGGPAWYSWQGQ
jgi:hypothetical protein